MNPGLIHLAGNVVDEEQRCAWCGVVLTEPGLTPFAVGAYVHVVELRGARASTRVDVVDGPTCVFQEES